MDSIQGGSKIRYGVWQIHQIVCTIDDS
jgi:hypothetical protein